MKKAFASRSNLSSARPAAPRESSRARDTPVGTSNRNVTIGLAIAVHPSLELADARERHAMPAALIRVGRVGEAIAHDPVAARERRADHELEVLAPRREHQQRLGVARHRLVQQQEAQRFAERRAAGLARRDRPCGPGRRCASAIHAACVLLPAPSMPSSVMKRPVAGVMRRHGCVSRGDSAQRRAELESCHGAIVIGEVRREFARAVAARDEIEKSVFGGCDRGVERRLPRQRDRRRRQTVARIRVVRRVGLEVALAQIAVEARAQAVDHRGIGLQPHAEPQPVDEHRGDQRPVGGAPVSFSTIDARISAAYGSLSGESAARRAHAASSRCAHQPVRAREEREIGRARREEIGVRKEPAFETRPGTPMRCASSAVGQRQHAS